MIYLLLTASLIVNGLLFWYIRKVLKAYWFDLQAREKFTSMLTQYGDSLQSIYKLEEFYGEEIIKKAVAQTKFVIEACNEFKESIDNEIKGEASSYESEEQDGEEDEGYEDESSDEKESSVIVLREGEKVTQDAGRYKKVILES